MTKSKLDTLCSVIVSENSLPDIYEAPSSRITKKILKGLMRMKLSDDEPVWDWVWVLTKGFEVGIDKVNFDYVKMHFPPLLGNWSIYAPVNKVMIVSKNDYLKGSESFDWNLMLYSDDKYVFLKIVNEKDAWVKEMATFNYQFLTTVFTYSLEDAKIVCPTCRGWFYGVESGWINCPMCGVVIENVTYEIKLLSVFLGYVVDPHCVDKDLDYLFCIDCQNVESVKGRKLNEAFGVVHCSKCGIGLGFYYIQRGRGNDGK